MTGESLPELTKSQKVAASAAAALFLLAVGFLGFSLANQILVPFAIGWVALQIFGYIGALKFANGDFSHPLFVNQVLLHVIALALLCMAILKALP